MRKYIFTQKERQMLRKWIKDGDETKTLHNLFSRIRRIKPRLIDDIQLFLETRRHLAAQHRWKLNVPQSTYTPHLGEHESTPRKKG